MYAWLELKNIEIIAVCDLNFSKAKKFQKIYNIKNSYPSIEKMLSEIDIDFADVVTTMETHVSICSVLSKNNIPTSIQKPFADTLINAKKIVKMYNKTKTPLMVHENFRWQTPLLKLKYLIKKHNLGQPFYSKISFRHSNPLGYTNQSYLYLV